MPDEYFFVRQDLCKIDLRKAALKSDIDFMNRFLRNDKVLHAVEETNFEREHPEISYQETVKSGVPLVVLPEKLTSALQACRDALGFTMDVKFYIGGPSYNAYVVHSSGQPVAVVMGAKVLEDFSSAEVAFVLGHELAHILYSHDIFPLNMQLHSYQVEKLISIKDKLHSNMWPRRAQVTADRIGLICCQDLEAAVSALYKVYAGASLPQGSTDVDALLAEYDRFQSTIKDWTAASDAYREIYPLSRVKCLKLFSESAAYGELTRGEASRNDEEVTGQIEGVLTAMEPAYLHDEKVRQKTKERFILTAGFFMMTADGKISDEEVGTLKTLVSSEVFDEYYPECEKFPRHELWRTRLYNRGQELEWFASVGEKHEIASNLVTVAYADGDLAEQERNALYEICSSLQLSPYTTEELLSEKSVLS